jgi:hypothetical protein
MGTATWLYAARRGLVRPGLPSDTVRRGTLRGLAIPIVMLGSLLLLPFAGTSAVQLSWVLIFPLQAFLGRLARECPEPGPQDEPAPDPPRTPPESAPG